MVYSAVRERDRGRPKRAEEAVGALVSTRAVVSLDDRRYVLDGPGHDRSLEVRRVRARRSQCLTPPRRAAAFGDRGLADR